MRSSWPARWASACWSPTTTCPAASCRPPALQINPRQAGCTYPYPHLAAAGIALKLALAFAAACGRRVDPAALLRVACLGTIADLVPLTGENRVIAALGLKALAQARSRGPAGADPAGRPQAAVQGRPTSASASARGSTPPAGSTPRSRPWSCCSAATPARALQLAAGLEGWNRQRQAEEARVVEEATAEPRRAVAACRRSWSAGARPGTRGWWGSPPAASPRSSAGRCCS